MSRNQANLGPGSPTVLGGDRLWSRYITLFVHDEYVGGTFLAFVVACHYSALQPRGCGAGPPPRCLVPVPSP